MEEEVWEPIPIKGKYEASNLGRVRNFATGTILSQRMKHGYLAINANKVKGKSKMYLVHRLVALAFIPNPLQKKTVNHIDGIKTNNNVKNLEWATQQENMYHAFKLGIISNHKLTIEQVIEIRLLYNKHKRNAAKLARQFNVSDSAIFKVVLRHSFKTIL